MKKIFTLLLTLVMTCGMAFAETYEWYVNGKNIVNDSKIFTIADSKTSSYTNSKYNGTFSKLNGEVVSVTNGVKIQSSTTITFTTQKPSTITIVQSLVQNASTENNVPVLDDNKIGTLDTRLDNPNSTDVNAGYYTIENVGTGEHVIKYGSKECGLFYIAVVENEGPEIPALATPEITFDAATGEVTITSTDNAPIYYTTDGSAPTAEGTLYEAPFTVADATVVRAASFGDMENYLNSEIAEVTVMLVGFEVAAPTIKSINGTFHIASATPLAKIYYTTDGENYQEFLRNVTLLENATVSAYATRENCTQSATVTAEVEALPAVTSDKTVLLGYGSFAADGQVLTVKSGDAAEGYVSTLILIHDDASKKWASGDSKKKIIMTHTGAGTDSRTAIKGSNGAPTKVTMAPGYKAVRVTLYSTVNEVTDVNCGWKEVNGVDYSASVSEVPMTSFSNDYATPDARIFNFDEPVEEFTFTNAGRQVVFVLAVDVIETPVELPALSLGEEDVVTLKEETEISFDHADATAEIWYRLTPYTEAAEVAALAEEGEEGEVTEEPAEAEFVKYDAENKPVFDPTEGHKLLEYYAVVNGRQSEVKSVVLRSGIESGITNVAADAIDVNAPVYNVLGQKVTPEYKGILIQNGKKYINR